MYLGCGERKLGAWTSSGRSQSITPHSSVPSLPLSNYKRSHDHLRIAVNEILRAFCPTLNLRKRLTTFPTTYNSCQTAHHARMRLSPGTRYLKLCRWVYARFHRLWHSINDSPVCPGQQIPRFLPTSLQLESCSLFNTTSEERWVDICGYVQINGPK